MKPRSAGYLHVGPLDDELRRRPLRLVLLHCFGGGSRVCFAVSPKPTFRATGCLRMKTLVWSLVLLINFAVAWAFVPSVFEGDIPAQSRAIGIAIGLLFIAICGLLIAARIYRLPSWGRLGMKLLCSAVPLSWLLGSLDHGMISGLEFLSLIFAAFLGWASWRAFLLFAPRPNPSINTDAAR
jgi:hypothetical protein